MRRPVDQQHFVERGPELARLGMALRRTVAGEPSVVVVAGDAGVGKSRLLREFATRVDGLVLWGGCLPMGERGLPFAPIVEALRGLDDESGLTGGIPASMAPLVSGTGDHPHAERVASRSQLFQAILGLLEDVASRTPTVLVIEDLHWSDPSTQDLLTFLVSNLRTQRLLVVASYRSDDLRRDHPLRAVLAELGRHPHVERLELRPFTVEQVGEQLEHLTGQRPAADALRRVVARTQGNAFFVEELVAAGLDSDDLPTSLRQLLLVRADLVSPAARRVLRIASLAEREVGDALLAKVSGTPLAQVRVLLREAVDAQLLVSARHGVLFRHALVREVLQQDLLAGERAEYHAAYARALRDGVVADAMNSAAAVAELAHHLEEAGQTTDAMGTWIKAATAAERVFAFAEAHQYLARALAAWDATEEPERKAGGSYPQLVARAAEDAFSGGDAMRACALVREAIAHTDEVGDARRAGILYERLSRYLRDTPDSDQVYEMIQRAVQLVPASPPSVDRARVLAGLAGRLSTLGRLHDARQVSEEAVGMARDVGSSLVECDALNTLGVVNVFLDDVPTGLAQIEAALALARTSGDAHQQMRSYWNLAVARAENGRWAEAIDWYRVGIEELPRLGLAHLLPELYMYMAQDLTLLGRCDEAQAVVDEAVRRFPYRRDEATPIELVVARGDFDEARRLVAAALSRNVFTDEEDHAVLQVNVADVEIWEGNHQTAREAVDAALRGVVDSDRPIALAHALRAGMRCEADAADVVRTSGTSDDLARVRTRAARFAGHMRDLLARSGPEQGWKREARALAAVCAGERARLDDAPDPGAWAAAVDATEAMSMGYLVAYARFRRGEAVMGATGDRDEASRELRRAHGAARDMGARPLIQLIERFARRARVDIGTPRGGGTTFGITPREREVLVLLVQGATNRQIAEQLFIAEKTASVHVSNIIRKLGVANRGQAAAAAHRAGLVGR